MGLLEQFLSPKTETILRIAVAKIIQRLPLSLCMAISLVLLTYTFIFVGVVVEGISLALVLLLTLFLAITISFALEYDSEDELMVLINIGVSPSDIFKLGIFRMWIISLAGYLGGLLAALLLPLSGIENVMLFYSFLIVTAFGVVPPIYSSFKSMHVSLLGRVAFKPLTEKEVPVLISPSELGEVKDFVKGRLEERQDVAIVDCSAKEGALVIVCRYLGDFGRETFAMLASLGISPDEALRDDETLPLVTLKVNIEEGKNPVVDCWEGRDKKIKRSAVSFSFQSLVRQLLIEYKVYKGRLRGDEYRRPMI